MEECYDVTLQSVQVCELTLHSTSEMNDFHKIWYKSHNTEGHNHISVLTVIQPVKTMKWTHRFVKYEWKQCHSTQGAEMTYSSNCSGPLRFCFIATCLFWRFEGMCCLPLQCYWNVHSKETVILKIDTGHSTTMSEQNITSHGVNTQKAIIWVASITKSWTL
jgi:hypothetical protein